MTPNRHGSAVIEFPNDLEIVVTREFDAPIELVFHVSTKPDVEAIESMDLHETDGVTRLSYTLTFRDQAGRDHMSKYDGLLANFDNLENYVRSLLDPEGAVSR